MYAASTVHRLYDDSYIWREQKKRLCLRSKENNSYCKKKSRENQCQWQSRALRMHALLFLLSVSQPGQKCIASTRENAAALSFLSMSELIDSSSLLPTLHSASPSTVPWFLSYFTQPVWPTLRGFNCPARPHGANNLLLLFCALSTCCTSLHFFHSVMYLCSPQRRRQTTPKIKLFLWKK